MAAGIVILVAERIAQPQIFQIRLRLVHDRSAVAVAAVFLAEVDAALIFRQRHALVVLLIRGVFARENSFERF